MTYTPYITNVQFTKLRERVMKLERQVIDLEDAVRHERMLKTGW